MQHTLNLICTIGCLRVIAIVISVKKKNAKQLKILRRENLRIYIYDTTQIRAKRDMTGKIYSIPKNAKLSTLFNNMFCE